MDILYLLIPMSVVLVLLILGVFGWALNNGQLEALDKEGERILDEDLLPLDGSQVNSGHRQEESRG